MKIKNNLTHIIYKYKDDKFSWGKLDCCLFSAKVIEEYTSRDLPYWREVNYSNRLQAMKIIKRLGCNTLLDLPKLVLGTNKKPISQVKLGELVYYIEETGEGIFGICNGAQSYFLNKEVGLVTRKTEDCIYSWSID